MITCTSWRAAAVLAAITLSLAGCAGGSGGGSGGNAGSATSTGAQPTASQTPGSSTPGSVPTSSRAPSARPSSESSPAMRAATGKPSVAISLAPTVKIGKPAQILEHVEVEIGKVGEANVSAHQPGEIAGSAAVVPITVRNTSSRPFNLNGLVVNAFYDGGTPGTQTSASPSEPLDGSLAVGGTAKGTYVFMVPREFASTLRLEVSSDSSPTIVQFAH